MQSSGFGSAASIANRFVKCRVCSSERILKIGDIEFYHGYAWPVYDCKECGCRFAPHDERAYDLLYAGQSSYSWYIERAASCKARFDRGDLAGLRAELSQTSKYRFVIEALEHDQRNKRILEIGCSRGHLSSYFILDGRDLMAIDVSPTAIAAARRDFGDHFAVTGDPAIAARAPYDVIFHVGTIGCVNDPIGMLGGCLDMLKPGGRLLFNAPNRDACMMKGQLWFSSAPPPDVVTLFSPVFWQQRFGRLAKVTTETEFCSPQQNAAIALRRVARRRWRKPAPIRLDESAHRWVSAPVNDFDGARRRLARAVGKLGAWTGLDHLAPRYPTEYGLFVTMIKQ